MEKEKIAQKLQDAYLADEYEEYEFLDNIADNLCPNGYVVEILNSGVSVFCDIDETVEALNLNEDDALTLQESGRITTDDRDLRIIT